MSRQKTTTAKAQADQNGAGEAELEQATDEELEQAAAEAPEPPAEVDVADLTDEQIMGLSEMHGAEGNMPIEEVLRELGEMHAKVAFLTNKCKSLYAANLRLTRDRSREERAMQRVAGRKKASSRRGKRRSG